MVAGSSQPFWWSWLYYLQWPLPVPLGAVVLTLVVETAIISGFGRIRNLLKTVVTISLENMLSFLAPVLIRAQMQC